MSKDSLKQPGTRVNESLWNEFREEVKSRRGAVRGHLRSELETALRQYINPEEGGVNNDQLSAIQEDLAEIKGEVSDETDKKKKETGGASTTEKRLRQIRTQIADESAGSPTVSERVIEAAIRDNAGSSDPTVRRYKALLKQDKALFEHPTNDHVYFRNPTAFCQTVNTMAKSGGLRGKEYDEIVQEYGKTWWEEQLEDDTERGIQ